MLKESDYEKAYIHWYCVTAKRPVSLSQYMKVMSRLPQDIKQINQWIDEGRKPI